MGMGKGDAWPIIREERLATTLKGLGFAVIAEITDEVSDMRLQINSRVFG
jgi:hypothetical protein